MNNRICRMKTIELQPRVWTQLPECETFQTKGQKVVRLALADREAGSPDPVPALAPDVDSTSYFLTPGFDSRPVNLMDYFPFKYLGAEIVIYAMPNGDEAVSIVAPDFEA